VSSYSALTLRPSKPESTPSPALVTVTPAFLSPTSAKPRIATPLLVTSAIAKLFRDFATLRPASEPLSRPNPLEGGCSCNGYLHLNRGECGEASSSGCGNWCYVDDSNTCRDARPSSYGAPYSWSCQACRSKAKEEKGTKGELEQAAEKICVTDSGATPNKPCIFPFKFNGVIYNKNKKKYKKQKKSDRQRGDPQQALHLPLQVQRGTPKTKNITKKY